MARREGSQECVFIVYLKLLSLFQRCKGVSSGKSRAELSKPDLVHTSLFQPFTNL